MNRPLRLSTQVSALLVLFNAAVSHLKIGGIEHAIAETPAGNRPAREHYYHVTLHDGRGATF